jgi:hypothetical protein
VGITVSGNADVTFWDDVTNTSGLFRVSAGSSATFFGGLAGNGISGGGDVYLEADITPGASPGVASFGGNVHFGQLTNLEIEIADTSQGTEYDTVDIAGTATLDGTLSVSLLSGFMPSDGDVFDILTAAGGITGTFATEILPALSGNLFWNVVYGTHSVALEVAAPGLAGDFNSDGSVDAADYVVWRNGLGTTHTPGDYDVWRAHFGAASATAGAAGSRPAHSTVPEPTTIILVVAPMLAHALGTKRSRYASRGGARWKVCRSRAVSPANRAVL